MAKEKKYKKLNKQSFTEYSKRNPFSVPEGYFDQLPDKIINRINKKDKKINYLYLPGTKVIYAAAAIIIIALVLGSVLIYTSSDKSLNNNYTDNYYTDSYIMQPEFINQFSEEELISALLNEASSKEDLVLFNELYEKNNEEINSTNKEENVIIDYLLEDDITNDILYEL